MNSRQAVPLSSCINAESFPSHDRQQLVACFVFLPLRSLTLFARPLGALVPCGGPTRMGLHTFTRDIALRLILLAADPLPEIAWLRLCVLRQGGHGRADFSATEFVVSGSL